MAWEDHIKGLAGSQSGPAPEPEDTTPSWLAPFRLKTYTDYGKRQFEAGDNSDLQAGIPQASFLARSLTSPIQTAKETASSIWDLLGKPLVEGGVRSYEEGRQLPRADEAGYYAGTPKAEKLDAFNAASIAPLGAFGAKGLGLADDVAKSAAAPAPNPYLQAHLDAWNNPTGPRFETERGLGLARVSPDDRGTFRITQGGQPIGRAIVRVKNDAADVVELAVDGGPRSLGVSGVRDLREAFRHFYPNVKEFSGNRVSGSRNGPAKTWNDRQQTVRLEANDGKAALPGVLVNAAKEIDHRGFYSPSLEAAKALKQQSGTVQQFKAQLLKAGGKPKELEAVGFDKAFPDPNAKVTRAEIEDYLRSNRVELGDTTYGGLGVPDQANIYTEFDQATGSFSRIDRRTGRTIGQYETEAGALDGPLGGRAPDTRFESYSTPGGIPGSYREVVTTYPGRDHAAFESYRQASAAQYGDEYAAAARRTPEEQAQFDALLNRSNATAANDYTSSHWPGVTNPLLHYRMKDFPGVEGSNTRLLDELQSDWGQRARDKGFRDPAQVASMVAERDRRYSRISELSNAAAKMLDTDGMTAAHTLRTASPKPGTHTDLLPMMEEYRLLENETMDLQSKINAAEKGAPGGAFVGNTSDWVDLGLKQSLIDAARDPSVSRFAWTPGDVQAQRYGMEHAVDTLKYGRSRAGDSWIIDAEKDGRNIYSQTGVPDAELDAVVGREMAERMRADPDGRALTGLDLKTGGEGHKKFYGTMSPEGYQSGIVGTRLQKLLKGLDPEAARIEGSHVSNKAGWHLTPPDRTVSGKWMVKGSDYNSKGLMFDTEAEAQAVLAEKLKLDGAYPSIPFTETLRKKILEEGLPLFVNDKNAALPGVLLNAAEQQPQGIRAYHGSPHDFDKFDMSKIGTGEGAQTYGQGLYFAEKEEVAKSYRDGLAVPFNKLEPTALDDVSGLPFKATPDEIALAKETLSANDWRPDRAASALRSGDGYHLDNTRRMAGNLVAALSKRATEHNPGRMYEVNIKADPEQFLDWDKPIAGQAQPIQDFFSNRFAGNAEYDPTDNAHEALHMLSKHLQGPTDNPFRSVVGNKEGASQALREAGIPGIRYLDGGSRGAGEGSSNYVLFRDDIIDIVKKYGVAAATASFGAEAVDAAMSEAHASLPERAFAPSKREKEDRD